MAVSKQALIAWLQSLTGNHTISAQQTHSNFFEIDQMISQVGIIPGMVVCEPWMDSSPYSDVSFVARAIDHWNQGGIVSVGSIWPNPAGGGAQSTNFLTANDVLTNGTSLNNAFKSLMDIAAGALQQFKNAGIPIIYRQLWEMDGAWFWWGPQNFNGAQYGQLWRLVHNYMTVTKGLDNLIWWFAPNGGPLTYTYPGDDVVDGVGFDCYTDDPGSSRYQDLYNTLRLQAPSKLMAFCEFGSGSP